MCSVQLCKSCHPSPMKQSTCDLCDRCGRLVPPIATSGTWLGVPGWRCYECGIEAPLRSARLCVSCVSASVNGGVQQAA